jgi:colanic acid/amylovoran biosynthesis protein
MRIFIIGQCSLHWGRMENGNLGNYYVLEPLIRELHQNFPYSELVTTIQLTEEFQKRENIKVLPLKLYYNWENDDIKIAEREYEIAKPCNYYCRLGRQFLKKQLHRNSSC